MARPSEAPRPRVSTPISRISLTRSPFASVKVRDSYACLAIERYALFVWRTEVTRPGVQAYLELLRRTVSESAQSVGALVYFKPGASVAHSAEARRELAQGVSALGGAVSVIAMVHDGGGFPAAVLRSSITSLQLEASHKPSSAFFSDRAAACRWVVHSLLAPDGHGTLLERGLTLLAADEIDPMLTGSREP